MSYANPTQIAHRRAASRLKSVVAPAIIIGGSTAVGVAIAHAVLTTYQNGHMIAAEVYGAINRIAGLDPLMVGVFVGVSGLVAFAAFIRRMA